MNNINRPAITLGKDEVSSCTPPNVHTPCGPSSEAIPQKQSQTQKQLNKADDQEQTDTGSEIWVAVTEDFYISQLPVRELDTTIGERREKLEKNGQSLNCECQPQSVPPSEENAIKDVSKVNMDQCFGIDVAKEYNRLLLNINSHQSSSCPSRPNSPEEVNPLPGKDSVWLYQKSTGCPAENDEAKWVAETQELIRKSRELLDKDTQELIRKTEKMYIAKEKECKQLAEIIRQQDKRNVMANVEVVMLKKENNELSEELDSLIGKVEKQQLDNEQKLQEERGKLQSCKKKLIEECKGFQESKRKQVKAIEVKLRKEKRKRKRMEIQLARERNQRKRVEQELARAKHKEKKMEKRNKKKMEELKENESFLVQELREKTVRLDNCQAQYTRLQQDLEECRGQIMAELRSVQTSSVEWQRRFQESTELIAETQELCRKATQMYHWKEQECERMREHIEQHDQKYDQCNKDLENLRKEREEEQQELHSAFEMVQGLRLEYDNKQKLLDKREYDLHRKMVEMSQASCKAESDRMKIMKVKLAEEIRQRRKMKRQLAKERNKRKRVELEKAIEKRRGKRMEKRKKEDTCQCLRKEEKGEGPSGGTRGGYGGHVSRDEGEGDLSSTASSDEESSKTEVTTCPDDSTEHEDTK